VYDLTVDATPLVNRAVQRWGRPYSSARAGHVIDNKWIGLPFYDRTGGYFVREDKFAEAGLPAQSGFTERWDFIKDACYAVSNPSQNFYGWGMTVNRSGDGQSVVNNIIWAWGGAIADPTGQIVTFFSPETIDAVTWLADIYMGSASQQMVPPGVNSWNDISNNEAWLAGTLAFTSNAGTLYAKSVVDGTLTPEGRPLADVTRLIQQPYGPFGTRLQGSGGHYFYFMKGSRNFDVAAQLADHMLSDEVQQALWRISPGYVVPAYENRWNHPIISENKISQSFRPVAFNEPPFQGVSYRGPLSEAADAVEQQSVQTDMMGEVLAGKPVIAAVRDAHLRMVDIYQSFGYKGR
jgi:multiple sugar transport system substrate-binding protein